MCNNWSTKHILGLFLEKGVSRTQVDHLNTLSWDLMLRDPSAGLVLCEEALTFAEKISYIKGIADSYLSIGWCRIYLADYPDALKNFFLARERYRETDHSEGLMKTFNALGVAYNNLGQIDTAIEYYQKSLDLARLEGNRERCLAALNNIGEVKLTLQNHEDAIPYLREAREIGRDLHLKGETANILANLAQCYQKSGKRDEAYRFFLDALELAREIEDRINEARYLSLLGEYYGKNGKSEEAIGSYLKSLSISEQTGDKLGQCEALRHLGKQYLFLKDYKKAEEVLKKTLSLSEEIHALHVQERTYKTLSRLFEEKENYKKSLLYFKEFYRIKQKVFSEETEKKLKSAKLEGELEGAKKEAIIDYLRDVELKEKDEKLSDSYRMLSAVSTLGQDIISTLDLDEITTRVHQTVDQLMDANAFGIAFYDEKLKEIQYKIFVESGKRLPVITRSVDSENSFAAWSIRNRREILMNDVEKEFHKYIRKRNPMGEKAASLMYIPLIVHGKINGIITVQSLKKNAFTGHHLDIMKALASYIAIAIENSINHEEVRKLNKLLLAEKNQLVEAHEKITHLANHDILTGLPNRRLFFELLKSMLAAARRRDERLGLLYLDLDDFKPVNDMLGHDVGDEVLKIIAKRLSRELRSSDTIARVGGDEFVVILPRPGDLPSMERVALKIIESLEEPIKVGNHSCQVGVSIGASLFPDDDDTSSGLMKRADRAMYLAKHLPDRHFMYIEQKKKFDEQVTDNILSSIEKSLQQNELQH